MSDATLKTNVEEIGNAHELINALQPKTYEFIPQQHPHMQMPQGRQWGVLAQELQEVMPELVERVPVPAVYDSTGAQVAEATSHLSVNYIGLIPVLIAAVKEQQAVIDQVQAENAALRDDMNDRLDQLEQALSACCANPANGGDQRLGVTPNGEDVEGDTRKLLIQPNPFNERTTLYYTLERAGRMQLLANSSDGKQLRVLQEATLEAGDYQHEWHTADLATGVYYVTLLLDGEPIVKKAVKVDR
ncbi:MAG: tail fiber domain-containing protein [Flavobacteriales bacterium]